MRYAGRIMKNLIPLIVYFVSTVARLLQPGGARTLLAESLLLRHQLLVLSRSRKRPPRLTALDRVLMGIWTLLIHPRRQKGYSFGYTCH